MYDQTKRRKTTGTAGKRRIRYGYDMLTAAAGEEEWRSSTRWWYQASVHIHIQRMERAGADHSDRRDAVEGRPGNLQGSRDGTDPCGGRCPTLPLPKARGGLK